jgi:NADPH:quinone reductase-like Zn-dependent oxidoreductase
MRTMVRFHEIGGPETLRLDEFDPPQPGRGEVQIRTRALGLNRADVVFRIGNHFFIPDFPQAQGLQASGTIESEPRRHRCRKPGRSN